METGGWEEDGGVAIGRVDGEGGDKEAWLGKCLTGTGGIFKPYLLNWWLLYCQHSLSGAFTGLVKSSLESRPVLA